MKHFSSILWCCLCGAPLFSQQKVVISIGALPTGPAGQNTIYLAGSFNGWNPRDERFRFQAGANGNYFIELALANGTYEYKITRGGWDKVECEKNGMGIANRQLMVDGNTTVTIDIAEWQDRFAALPRKSTAGKTVQILDTAFFIPQLNKFRRIWIYLPEDYADSRERYPVLYMHDGQNVFEDSSSFSGEWGVDEYLDTTKARRSIIVAVDHGGKDRIAEYCPYDMERFGKGAGVQYVDFITKTLRPFINKKYRTKRCRKNTFIAGSSMGGLISMYALLKYPRVFGGAGVFSPAFWVGPKIFDEIRSEGKRLRSRIFLYAGIQEGEMMVPHTMKALELLDKFSRARIRTVIRQEGKHNEARWRKEFPGFYEWTISSGQREGFQ